MNWEAIGAVGEIGGAVAVVLTLAFLALQIRQNTKALRSESTNNATSTIQGFYINLGGNEQVAQNWFQGMTDPDSLTGPQTLQFYCQCHAAMLGFQDAFFLGEHGTLDYHIRDSIVNVVLNTKDQPGFHRYWAERSTSFDRNFREFIDELMRSDVHTPGQTVYERKA